VVGVPKTIDNDIPFVARSFGFATAVEEATIVLQRAHTVALNALVIGQVFYLLNSRYLLDSSLSLTAHKGNKYLPLGIGAVVILQLLFTYTRPFQVIFGTEAIPLRIWPWLFAGGLVFFLVVEVEKLVIRSSSSLRKIITSVEAGTQEGRKQVAAMS
jgi:magnesium-transporting ATPase (P-type)